MLIHILLSITLAILSFLSINRETQSIYKRVFALIGFSYMAWATGSFYPHFIFYTAFIVCLILISYLVVSNPLIPSKIRFFTLTLLLIIIVGHLSSFLGSPFKFEIFYTRVLLIILIVSLLLKNYSLLDFVNKKIIFFVLMYFILEIFIKYLNSWW